jgi:hypothetical protein
MAPTDLLGRHRKGNGAHQKMETTMTTTTITLHDDDGTAYEADFRAIEVRAEATIGLATVVADGENFRVPAVVYNDGTIIRAKDWQGLDLDDEDIVEEASDPAWAHHWTAPNGGPVVVFGGLPRLLG